MQRKGPVSQPYSQPFLSNSPVYALFKPPMVLIRNLIRSQKLPLGGLSG